MSSGISIGTPTRATTLSSLEQAFQGAKADQHLRFSDAKGLHTHGSMELTKVDFLAKFRNADALQERADLRKNAIDHVKTAIDNEFGKGMGDRVFDKMRADGTMGAGGVEVQHLGEMSRIASDLRDRDMSAAETRLGDTIGSVIKTVVERHGEMFQDGISGDRQVELKHKIATAILSLPTGATKAQMERAAEGAILMDEIIDLAKDVKNYKDIKGFTQDQKNALQTLFDQAFKPSKDADADYIKTLSQRPTSALLPILIEMADTLKVETGASLLKKADSATLGSMTSQQKAQIVYDAIKGETEHALKQGGDAEKSFIRGTAAAPHFDIVTGLVEGHFKPQLQGLRDALATHGSSMEYREVELTKAGRPSSDAVKAFQAFDAGMTALLGGSTPDEIRANVRTLPQELCDFVATAHKAMTDAETALAADGKSGVSRGDAAKYDLDNKLNINLLFLRSINPMLVVEGGLAKDKNLMAFSKLLQNTANSIDPTRVSDANKEKPPKDVAASLTPTFTKWEAAVQVWMEAVAARGRSIV